MTTKPDVDGGALNLWLTNMNYILYYEGTLDTFELKVLNWHFFISNKTCTNLIVLIQTPEYRINYVTLWPGLSSSEPQSAPSHGIKYLEQPQSW